MSLLGPTFSFSGEESVPRVVAEALIHRAELASLEFEEAQRHGVATVVIAVVSAGLLLLGGFAGTFALAASVWNRDDRGLILGCVALGYLVAAVTLGVLTAKRLKAWQPFVGTRKQFLEDCACIHGIVTSGK